MPSSYRPITIILADDHEIFRDGFCVLLSKLPDIKLIAEASNGEELIKLTRKLHPDIVITDIKMPVMDGIEATKVLTKEYPDIGIIALSMFDEENLIVDMLEAGAKGYLLKNAQKEEIITAVKSVYKDEPYYCTNTTKKLAHMIANSHYDPYKKVLKPEFSGKEIEVIKLICREYSNKQIAHQLSLSKRTIEGYREKLLKKINVKNSVGIVVYAIKHNIF